jgi:hypothetical protein
MTSSPSSSSSAGSWLPVSVGVAALALAGSFALCAAVPLAAYTFSLSMFGLAHALTEFRFVDERFSGRLPGWFKWGLAGLLAAAALGRIGGEPIILRGALKPAKPIITGRIGAVPILGLAGTAYATTVAAHLFLRPWLGSLAGLAADDPFLPAIATFSRPREGGRAEALPVRMRREGPQLLLDPAGRFGQLSALAAMDGFALIDDDVPEISPGTPLLYHPLLMPLI